MSHVLEECGSLVTVGRLFLHQLLLAADRGVRVRLLVDDMDLGGRDLGAAALDSHPNMEVRLFNPFSRNVSRVVQFVTRMGSVTRRMHNKSFTVDNQAAILGGRNIGDEYFNADPEMAFGDLDVLVIGSVVDGVSRSFDAYWNSELAYPATVLAGREPTHEEARKAQAEFTTFIDQQRGSPYIEALAHSDLAQTLREDRVHFDWGEAVVVADGPEKLLPDADAHEFRLAPMLRPYFAGVQQELIILSPYFVPGKQGTAFLIGIAARGVHVRILTNSLSSTDVGVVHAGYAKYRKDLLRHGVELYELNMKLDKNRFRSKTGLSGSARASLHAKAFVFDRKRVFIGSLNLDPRSMVHNTEIGVVFASETLAHQMADAFDRRIEALAFRLELQKGPSGMDRILWHGVVEGSPRTFTAEPFTGFWRRLGVGLLGLLPIESQL